MKHYATLVAMLEQKRLKAAVTLLQQWRKKAPHDPWLTLGLGRYWEATNNLEKAEAHYRQVLKIGGYTRLIAQARQGIQRIQDAQAQTQAEALSQSQAQPDADAPALLLLEPVLGNARQQAAQGLAKVMQMDTYTARMLIPGKHWRLYRVGKLGNLRYFGQQLQAAQTPAFWLPFAAIKSIATFQVQYIKQLTPDIQVICKNAAGELGQISFTLEEVSQRVKGRLPIFESVVDLGPWGKLQRKQQTQDYAEVIDLHLYDRRSVLRFCDRSYQYRHSITLLNPESVPIPTAQQGWQRINQLLNHPNHTVYDNFSGFGESALEWLDLLPDFDPHLALKRREPSPWDAAFHMYGSLCYLRSLQKRAQAKGLT